MYQGKLFFFPHARGFPELNTALFSHPKSAQLQSQEDVAGGTGPVTGRVEKGGDVTRECGPAQAFATLSESSKHAGTREERYFALVTKTCSSIFSQAPAHPKINCWPGYWLLACDSICLMLQSGKQVGYTRSECSWLSFGAGAKGQMPETNTTAVTSIPNRPRKTLI